MGPGPPRRGFVAIALSVLGSLALAQGASAARTVYFADPVADEIAQLGVGPGGALTPLAPRSVPADDPHRLAMTPEGDDLYATAEDGVLQYDVAPDGRLTPKTPSLRRAGSPHSIAVHPNGASAYVSDSRNGKVRQYDIAAGGVLAPKTDASVPAGPAAKGVAVNPDGRTAYALVLRGIVVYDVAADGNLTPRQFVFVPSYTLQDLALTPNGDNLYVTSRDGRVLQFNVDAAGTPGAKAAPAVALPRGVSPIGIAVVPNGSAAYVSTQAGRPGRRLFAFAIGSDGALGPGTPPSLAVAAPTLWYLSATPDGRSLFVAGGDGHLFNIGPGASVAPKTPPAVDLRYAVGVVVSPNQAPVARFVITSAPATAGLPIQFDASGASDPDGTIVRYDWDFGDGTVLPNGGPTPTHVYRTPGTYLARLTVTDNEGASTGTVFTGATPLESGGPGAESTLSIQVTPAPAPPPPAPAQAPRPDLGESLLAETVSGRIRVRPRGADRFVPLSTLRELPVGSTIDARRGRVEVTTVRGARRRNTLQSGIFRSGLFRVRQRARDRFITDLVLSERLVCPRGGNRARASRAKRRRLWGNGNGRFRSRGQYSSAAVRGTRWLVRDRCGSTLTVVRSGRVAVRDFVRDRTVVLRRGQRYVARARG